jgi:DNA-binding MarR family transcriptional regulator
MKQGDDLRAWSALVTVYQSVLHDVVRALEDEAGIDSGMFSVLAHLERATPAGRRPLGELQALMHPRYSQPGLSRLVQRMDAARLVRRRPDPDDGRAAHVEITGSGRARFAQANVVYARAVQREFGAHLDPRRRDALVADLEQITDRRERPLSRRARPRSR